jgi:hypothetical protein
MEDGYPTLGGHTGAPRPDAWHADSFGTSWAAYGVYVTSNGRMAHSTFWSRNIIGVVFAVRVGPRQRRRFARFDQHDMRGETQAPEWFARSEPFGHPRELIAAAVAAGEPFRRPRIFWGPGVSPRGVEAVTGS